MKLFAAAFVVGALGVQVAGGQVGQVDLNSPSAKMAATVIKMWPDGVVSNVGKPGVWAYEEGVLLDGMAGEWHSTAVGADFKYIKAAVDKYVIADGTIKTFGAEAHSLDSIEMG